MEKHSYSKKRVIGDEEYDRVRKARLKRRRNLKKRRLRNQRIAFVLICCFSIIIALGALVYVVNHADEFENVKGAEAAGLNDKTTADADDIDNVDSVTKDSSVDDSWQLILANKDHKVPDDYKVELTELSNGQKVDSRIYPDLQNMFDDMRSEGFKPLVMSGYRTIDYQSTLLQDEINKYKAQGFSQTEAEKEAEGWVAVPGTSEHHLGLAVDINSDIDVNNPDSTAAEQALYQWLEDNAYRYGFILRYPPGKEGITGVNYEPWHYRYVGVENAEKIHSSGLTLEEYLGE